MNKPCRWALLALAVASGAVWGDGAKVFRCEINGKVIYSDTACAQAANQSEVDTNLHNTYSAPPPSPAPQFRSSGTVSRATAAKVLANARKAREASKSDAAASSSRNGRRNSTRSEQSPENADSQAKPEKAK